MTTNPLSEVQHVLVTDKWPEAVSDGLTLSCSICGHLPAFDFNVTDWCWNRVVPDEHKRDVVCLRCFDFLASSAGIDSSQHLIRIQFTGLSKTVELRPVTVYHYENYVRRGG